MTGAELLRVSRWPEQAPPEGSRPPQGPYVSAQGYRLTLLAGAWPELAAGGGVVGVYQALGREKMAYADPAFEIIEARGFDALRPAAMIFRYSPYGAAGSMAVALGCRGPFFTLEGDQLAFCLCLQQALTDLGRGRCERALVCSAVGQQAHAVLLARISHQPPTAARDSFAASRPSPSSLLQRTASTPQSASGPRSANLLRSHTPRDGVGEQCRLACISHQPPTAARDSFASSRPSPCGLLQRTASTPQSASGPRSTNLLRSHAPRDGVGEICRPGQRAAGGPDAIGWRARFVHGHLAPPPELLAGLAPRTVQGELSLHTADPQADPHGACAATQALERCRAGTPGAVWSCTPDGRGLLLALWPEGRA